MGKVLIHASDHCVNLVQFVGNLFNYFYTLAWSLFLQNQETLINEWFIFSTRQVSCIIDMEPSGYGIDGSVRYLPPVPEDYLIAIELDAYSFHFEAAEDVEKIFHNDSETPPSKDTGTWFQMAEIQVASVGKLQPVRH